MFQAMRHKKGIQRQGGECVLRGHSGVEALGGGLFEEVIRPPLGKCSLNTHRFLLPWLLAQKTCPPFLSLTSRSPKGVETSVDGGHLCHWACTIVLEWPIVQPQMSYE
jgi:hypothetical protein